MSKLVRVVTAMMALATLGATDWLSQAHAGLNQLQQWYNTNTCLWENGAGWWPSANGLIMLADLALHDSSFQDTATSVFLNTFSRAKSLGTG